MTTVQAIAKQFIRIGYRVDTLMSDFAYSDMLGVSSETRSLQLAAFSHTPPSYRTAAFGVMVTDANKEAVQVAAHRGFGAPIILAISGNNVSVWQIKAGEKPARLEVASLDDLDHLFERHRIEWHPDAIYRAKSIGLFDRNYQLDFVDIGLLPAIEGQIHTKLDHLLQEVFEALHGKGAARSTTRLSGRDLFYVTFRLLAAKILLDREHSVATAWDRSSVSSVLNGISQYYGLAAFNKITKGPVLQAIADAWRVLNSTISFAHVSSDDLAFVYENTLVTRESRQKFGTHSTPRQLAEYITVNLHLTAVNPEELYVYEPFAGAGILLTSAMRQVRDSLPRDWEPSVKHKYLTTHIWGHEFDQFACEVATLSLILADYPQLNGWHIDSTDLFSDNTLISNVKRATVVLCNPPWEQFTDAEAKRYAAFSARSKFKPIAVLDAVLEHPPASLGFVLPNGILVDKRYAGVRRKLELHYRDLHLLSLPDGIFQASQVQSAVLIAKNRRSIPHPKNDATMLTSVVVKERHRDAFLASGQVTDQRVLSKPFLEEQTGNLWISELADVWDYLADYHRLEEVADVHRGLEWNYSQDDASAPHSRVGFKAGLHRVRGALHQFLIGPPVYLDLRKNSMRGNAHRHPWNEPKVIANASRLSRGPWRFAAAVDHNGLYASQQFFGMWLKPSSTLTLETLAAILNGPIANAFLTTHNFDERFLVRTVESIPLPRQDPGHQIPILVRAYVEALEAADLDSADTRNQHLEQLLFKIDAEILATYDLPPRLERQVLEYFRGASRPVPHTVNDWFPESFKPCIPLREYINPRFLRDCGPWVLKVFKPLPDDEAAALEDIP